MDKKTTARPQLAARLPPQLSKGIHYSPLSTRAARPALPLLGCSLQMIPLPLIPLHTQQHVPWSEAPAKRQIMMYPLRASGGGQPATLGGLPEAVLGLIFIQCSLQAQRCLAHTARMFRNIWKCLELPPTVHFSERERTASSRWALVQKTNMLGEFRSALRLDIDERPCETTLLPGNEHLQYASLVGHLSQILLQTAVVEGFGKLPQEDLGSVLCEVFGACHFPVEESNDTFLLTFKLTHSRQAGFSNAELDALGFLFRHVPATFAQWVKLHGRQKRAYVVCPPNWHLIAPDGSSLKAFWLVADHENISVVADVADLGIS